jgi:hypothetical protein
MREPLARATSCGSRGHADGARRHEDGDMTALFIINKPFDIRYAFEDEQEGSTG